jgi:hypothetical protein
MSKPTTETQPMSEPLRRAQFIRYLHEYRAQVGAKPVSDEIASQAFDMIESFIVKWVTP